MVGNAAMVLHRSVVALVGDRRRQLGRALRRRRAVGRRRGRVAGGHQAGSGQARDDQRRRRALRRARASVRAASCAALGVIVRVTVLTVPVADAELAADRMMQAGAFAVEERDVGDGTVELRASLADGVAGRARAARRRCPPAGRCAIDEVDATPADTWRELALPIEVADDLVIRPAWLPPLDRPGVTEVAIEPGAAFGLGDHPTTRLSAAAVWRLGAGRRHACSTSGAARACSRSSACSPVPRRAVGVDIAEAAVPVTLDNAARNGVGGSGRRVDHAARATSTARTTSWWPTSWHRR